MAGIAGGPPEVGRAIPSARANGALEAALVRLQRNADQITTVVGRIEELEAVLVGAVPSDPRKDTAVPRTGSFAGQLQSVADQEVAALERIEGALMRIREALP